MHQQPGPVHRRGQAQIARVEPLARLQAQIAFAEIEPGGADITPGLARFFHDHPIAVALGVFLDDDAIGAVGHWRAGENPHRFARSEFLVIGLSGRDVAHHLELGRNGFEIGRPHGIAVHRRDRERRLGAPRRHLLGQHTAQALRQRHLFGAQGLDDGEQAFRASSTEIIAARLVDPRLAAGFVHEADFVDPHAAVDRLAHVVDRRAPRPRPRSAPPSRRRCGP